jgi:hypothetical protein
VTVVAAIGGVAFMWRSSIVVPEMRLEIATARGALLNFAISPDGNYVVSGAGGRLWLRALADEQPRPLEGAQNAARPFWSPDSQFIAFNQGGQLRRLAIEGGSAQVIANVEAALGASWGADGTIVFARANTSPLLKVAVTGGSPEEATRLDSARQVGHRFPSFRSSPVRCGHGRHLHAGHFFVTQGLAALDLREAFFDLTDKPLVVVDQPRDCFLGECLRGPFRVPAPCA